MALAMQAGEIDVTHEMPYSSGRALLNSPSLKVVWASTATYRELGMRVDQKPFNDKRVRLALALSLDRPGIVQTVLGGHADLGNDHGFWPAFPLTPKTLPQRTQDLKAAKSLLAAAGYAGGINVTLTTQDFQELVPYVTLVAEQAANAGITISLSVIPGSQFYGPGKNPPWLTVPFVCVDWGARPVPSLLIQAAYTCTAVWNSAKWCNRQFDQAMKLYGASLDIQKRKQYAATAAKIMHDEVPAVIAYFIQQPRFMVKNLFGVVVSQTNWIDLRQAYLA
jgi:peptide/nickel transport system substrate-binding protein